MNDTDQKRIFMKNLNRYISKTNKTQLEIATAVGVSAQTFNTWCRGIAIPRMGKIQKLADYFHINKSDLIEDKTSIDSIIESNPGLHPIRKIRKVPILGTIACGSPIWADENFDGYVGIDPTAMDGEFALYAKGDSMIDAEIHDGDLVLLKKASTVDNGKIAAVLIENEATLKKVYRQNNQLILQPCNSAYAPLVFDESNASSESIMILGECVGVYHPVD